MPEMDNVGQYIDNLFSVNMMMLFSPNAKNLAPNMNDLLSHFKSIKGLQASIREPNSDKYYAVNDLRIKLTEIKEIESKLNPIQAKKMLHDCVLEYNNNLETFEGPYLDDTPWFNAWKKAFLSNLENNDHEFIGAYIGVMFFLAESDLDNFRDVLGKLLTEAKSISNIKWFSPNFLKYCVVLSIPAANSLSQSISNDNDSIPTETSAPSPSSSIHPAYCDLVAMYDTNKCFWFEIDPMTTNSLEESSSDPNNLDTTDNVPGHHFNSFDHNHQDPLTFLSSAEDKSSSDVEEESVKPVKSNVKPIMPICQKMLEKCDKLLRRMFVRAVIPWCERQLSILAEALASRKGLRRSIFSATKQLLAMSSSTMSLRGTNQSIVYSLEANEMQYRKFADLTMCLGLYDVAYSSYYAARKEFQSEGAWLYYAGASESAAIASYLLNKFQKHYLDQAIVYYMESSKASHLATRATLFATDAICDSSPNEAASFFIRLTSEDSDLRSALFLEQAAKCFQTALPSRKRKSAFHFVLAGHRYNRCGLKRLALCSYLRYSSFNWSHAIEHVNFTVAKLYLSISSSLSNSELQAVYRSKGLQLLQTNADKQLFFTEFIKELKAFGDDDNLVTNVNIPKIESITKVNIEGSHMKGTRQVCFCDETVCLNITLSSSFPIVLNNLRLLVDNESSANCPPIELALEAYQGTTVTCSFIPTVICDFNVIGIRFDILGTQFVHPFSDRLTKNLMFTSIQTLPLMNVNIKLATFPDNSNSIELYTGQIVELTIKLNFADGESIPSSQYQAKLLTNGKLKGVDATDCNSSSIPLSIEKANCFKFQAPFLPSIFPLFFKIIYCKTNEPLKERTITHNVDLFVRECLQLDGLFHSVVSLKNLLTSSSIILFSGDNEQLEVGPGLTGHILAHDNYIHWESNNNTCGDINISL